VSANGEKGPPGLRTSRLEAFSDGVFAIAITLLVLELAVPAASADHLIRALAAEWPSYLAYVVSFASIGAIWLQHTLITEYLDRADEAFVRLNLLLLLVVSFLPFPTKVLAEYINETGPERVAVTFYGIVLMLSAILISVMWRYGVRKRLVRVDANDEEIRLLTKRLTPGLAIYLVVIGLGLFLPTIAVFGYLAIAIFFLVPVRRLRRDRSR